MCKKEKELDPNRKKKIMLSLRKAACLICICMSAISPRLSGDRTNLPFSHTDHQISQNYDTNGKKVFSPVWQNFNLTFSHNPKNCLFFKFMRQFAAAF